MINCNVCWMRERLFFCLPLNWSKFIKPHWKCNEAEGNVTHGQSHTLTGWCKCCEDWRWRGAELTNQINLLICRGTLMQRQWVGHNLYVWNAILPLLVHFLQLLIIFPSLPAPIHGVKLVLWDEFSTLCKNAFTQCFVIHTNVLQRAENWGVLNVLWGVGGGAKNGVTAGNRAVNPF